MLIPANYSLNLNRTSQIFSQSDSKHLLSLDYSRPNQTRQDFLIHFFSTEFNLNPAVFLVDAKFTKLFLHGLLKSVKST